MSLYGGKQTEVLGSKGYSLLSTSADRKSINIDRTQIASGLGRERMLKNRGEEEEHQWKNSAEGALLIV